MTARVLFVGWDGADWAVLDPLTARGLLPTLAELRRAGTEGVLRSTFPPHSVAAWASFLTGLPPRGHGIIDFRRCRSGRAFPDAPHGSGDVPAPTVLDALSKAGLRVFAANIPMTYPPRPLNGCLISGVFLPEHGPITFPPTLEERVSTLGGFPRNGMRWARADDLRHLFLEVSDVIQRRTEVFLSVLQDEPWDVALLGFMAPDRLQHAAMHLLDPSHPGHADEPRLIEPLHAAYAELDRSLGRLLDAAQPAQLVVASDHGFRSVHQDLVPNRMLESLGHLRFRQAAARLRRVARPLRSSLGRSALAARAGRSLAGEHGLDWARTVGYAPSVACQGVRLNLEGRDPHGSIPASKADRLLTRLVADLTALRDPRGEPCFARVWTAEEDLPNLRGRPGVPDVFYQPARHLGLTGEGRAPFVPLGRKTGEHRAEGVVVRTGAGPVPQAIWEVSHLLLDMAGVSGPWGHLAAYGTGTEPGGVPGRQEREILDQLQSLGYVD